jgi:hypothetical protein
MRRVVCACLGLATGSLLMPSQPSYDPWAWLVWGREIDFLRLDTTAGPSWKPLPVAFDALVAPLGRLSDAIPPALWLVVARSAGLLAVALAFRLASRLAGGGRAGAFAGVLAAAGLALTPLWVRYLGHGSEAPIAVAFGLWGIERHLDGVRHQALILGVLACLLRPEVFPFVALYAAYLWRVEPERQVLIAVSLVALPVLWIVPEWIGSGRPLSGEQQATSEPSWSLSHAARPWLAALNRAHHQVGLPLELGALAGLAVAAARRERTALVMGVVILAWAAMFAAMTQAGFSGNFRYFLPALPLISILAGVGAARLVTLGARAGPLAGGAVAACVLASLVPSAHARIGHARAEARRVADLARLQGDLHKAVQRVGGPEAVVPHGAPTVNRAFETRLAWELKLSLHDVEVGQDKGVVFRTDDRLGTPKRLSSWVAPREVLARVGEWRVFASPPSLAVFSHSSQQ